MKMCLINSSQGNQDVSRVPCHRTVDCPAVLAQRRRRSPSCRRLLIMAASLRVLPQSRHVWSCVSYVVGCRLQRMDSWHISPAARLSVSRQTGIRQTTWIQVARPHSDPPFIHPSLCHSHNREAHDNDSQQQQQRSISNQQPTNAANPAIRHLICMHLASASLSSQGCQTDAARRARLLFLHRSHGPC
jgi:hypothetical protein